MDTISEVRLQEVHPRLARQVHSMAEMLAEGNIQIRVTQGLRTWAEQAALWAKGRDSDGNITNESEVVTHAKPGYSYHNFGLAVDVAPFDDDIPDWNRSHPAWARIVEVGESVGLTAGAKWRTFPDWPHFQMVGVLPVNPDDATRATYARGGIEAVWSDTLLETT